MGGWALSSETKQKSRPLPGLLRDEKNKLPRATDLLNGDEQGEQG
jgi:hypothetical protein